MTILERRRSLRGGGVGTWSIVDLESRRVIGFAVTKRMAPALLAAATDMVITAPGACTQGMRYSLALRPGSHRAGNFALHNDLRPHNHRCHGDGGQIVGRLAMRIKWMLHTHQNHALLVPGESASALVNADRQSMNDPEGPFSHIFADLFGSRPGWRLEPSSSPGGTPVWCFVSAGRIGFSVTADADSIHLYEMETDRELTFINADELATWLTTHRAEAFQQPVANVPRKSRFRKLFEWN